MHVSCSISVMTSAISNFNLWKKSGQEKAKTPQFSTLDAVHISCNAALMKYGCRYTQHIHPHAPQYHREALSSCAGCLTAHPSPPGTGPRELKDMMQKVAHKYHEVPKTSEGGKLLRSHQQPQRTGSAAAVGFHMGRLQWRFSNSRHTPAN